VENLSILTKPQKCLIFKANNELKNLKLMNDLLANTETYVIHIKNACKEAKSLFGEAPPDVFIMIGSCGKELIAELKKLDPNSKRLNVWSPKKNENINKNKDGDEFTTANLRNYLPKPFKEGHYGTLHLFSFNGKRIMLQEGRAHLYEDQDMKSITFTVRMLAEWGTELLMTTSRSHSIPELLELNTDNLSEESGIAIITDHVNEAKESPFTGIILGEGGVGKLKANEINMSDVYDEDFQRKLLEKFRIFGLKQKVYVFIKDISYSTPAELKKFSEIDGVVGVSLVPETVAAYQAGMRVVAFTEYAKHRSKKFAPNPYFIDVLLKSIEHMLDIKIEPQPQKQEEKTEVV